MAKHSFRKFLVFLLLLPLTVRSDTELPPNPNGLDITDIDFDSLRPAVEKLLDARAQRKPVVALHFDSPGGSVAAMFAFAQVMRHTHLGGTQIICVADGMVASAAFYIFQVCDLRVAYPGSVFMAHEVSMTGIEGKPEAIQAGKKVAETLTHIMSIQIASRLNISLEEFEKRIKDTDWWMTAQEAKAIGAVDAVMPQGFFDP